MTKSEAIDAIRSSISRGSGTPNLGSISREAYIKEKALSLEQAAISPIAAIVQGVAHEHGLLDLLNTNLAWVIAREDEDWLGFVPSTGDFFLAYGSSPENLNALGFYSDDALAEWLG